MTTTAAYIHPRANVDIAIKDLNTIISQYENAHPDALFIVGGDFNQANLRKQMPKFHQHVSCPTRGTKTLDRLYCHFGRAYKSNQWPHVGNSDHAMILLVPDYEQQLKRSKLVKKTICLWPESSIDTLRGCFECTDRDVFKNSGDCLDEYADTVFVRSGSG